MEKEERSRFEML